MVDRATKASVARKTAWHLSPLLWCICLALTYNVCINGCTDGHWGSHCTYKCPPTCSKCSSNSDCSECRDGYYNGYRNGYSTRTCGHTCPTGCKSCTSSYNCDKCVDGKHGSTCSYNCGSNCISCTSSNNCDKCVDGKYGTTCNESCRSNCRSCTSVNTCDKCVDGKYGTICNESCRSNCRSCTSVNTCDKCVDGKYGTICNESCRSNCRSCTSVNTCDKCVDGKYGTICNESCRSNCRSCTSFNKCDKCVDGKYGTTCNESCRSNCRSCTSVNTCDKCVDGKYGTICNESCRSNCRSCTSFNKCDKCVEGKYGTICSESCRSNCRSCTSVNTCDKCADGKYGTICNESCRSNCRSCTSVNTCDKCVDGKYGTICNESCRSNCRSCTSFNKCDKCIDGKYGTTCNESCRSNCRSCTSVNTCDKCVDGKYGTICNESCRSNCRSCTSFNKCDKCVEGKYGTICSESCRSNCRSCTSLKCDICNDGYYSIYCWQCLTNCISCTSKRSCNACKQGYYGSSCAYVCSIGCDARVCNKLDGACNCTVNFTGSKCDKCVDGNYGTDCSLKCAVGCLWNTCDKSRGTCKCKTGLVGELCDKCKNGKYGSSCNITCPSTCVSCISDVVCDQCSPGYYISSSRTNCTIKCPANCSACNSSGVCTDCKPGYYGPDCQLLCPNRCNGALCHKINGTCISGCNGSFSGSNCENCLVGKHGTNCDLNCSANCLNGVCEKSTGTCMACVDGGNCSRICITNRYGKLCNRECGKNCLSDNNNSTRCFDRNGTCVFGCIQGYHGDMCGMACSSNCKNVSCERFSGRCYHGCIGSFADPACMRELKLKDDADTLVIVGSSSGVFLLLLIVVIVALVVTTSRRRRRNTKTPDKTEDETSTRLDINAPTHYNTASETVKVSVSSKPSNEGVYSNVTIATVANNQKSALAMRMSTVSNEEICEGGPATFEVPTADARQDLDDTYYNVVRRIQVRKLAEYVSKKSTADFDEEFKAFPNGLVTGRSYAVSQKSQNTARNRYRSIYPYDEHRVRLTGQGSDYINASYIDGFDRMKAYIACLGPTDKTTEHFVTFWRMVWQQNVGKIVMVTNLLEQGNQKCDKYWPDVGTSTDYGGVSVTCINEDVYADYTFRSFTISQQSKNRTLYHIHFTAWPDKGVPDDVTSLIEFRQKVESTQTSLEGPTIVHCSAGVGRTGTYIALDILTKAGEMDKAVDIFGCVMQMREQRVNMVQTAEQYEYLHNALVHSLTFECQPIRGDRFLQLVATFTEVDLDNKFQQLKATEEKKTDSETVAIQRNKQVANSNRDGADVPGDCHRPRLFLNRTSGSRDYINAVYVDSFKRKSCYIIAQTPLPETVLDFVSLVYQCNCSCIISMEPIEALEERTVGTYYPADNQMLDLKTFKVTSSKETSTSFYILRKLIISYNGPEDTGEKTVYHFHYTQWKKPNLVPDDPASFLQMTEDMEQWANKSGNDGPVIVHCLNGGEKSGLFCVISVLIQKMETEQEVSVVNTVRKVKSRRGNAIPNKEQYAFCFRCVTEYLQSFDTYSNFSLRT